MLIEIAPGIELQKDVIDLMDFCPIISPELKLIDPIVYSENKIGLKEKFNRSL
jgi:acyl CoA:acetate/3-ketoacid CoA transferase